MKNYVLPDWISPATCETLQTGGEARENARQLLLTLSKLRSLAPRCQTCKVRQYCPSLEPENVPLATLLEMVMDEWNSL